MLSLRSRFAGLLAAMALALLAAVPAAAQQPAATPPPAAELTPEQAQALGDILRDEATRAALLNALDRIGETEEGATVPEEEPPTPISVGREIAASTQAVAENIANAVIRYWALLGNAPQQLDDALNISPQVVIDAVSELALVIVTTVAIFLLLRRFARRLDRMMGAAAAELGALRSGMLMALSILIDVVVVLLAWAAGYVIALMVFGSAGEIAIHQTLYLNAFLTVEMVKVVLRAILSPVSAQLRPINVPNRAAKVMSRYFGVTASVLGYGQLLVVPIVNQNVSFAAGRSVSALLSAFAVLLLIWLVVRSRRAVADWLTGEAVAGRRGMVRGIARLWHVAALLYLAGLLVLVLARPGNVLIPVLGASAEIAAAVIIGLMAVNFLGKAISTGVRVPEKISARLPLLEVRLNAFVPQALRLLRLIVFAGVVAFTLDTLSAIDVEAWLVSQAGAQFTAIFLSVLLVLTFSFAVWLSLSSWVEYRLNADVGRPATSRERTLLSLLRNAATIVLVVITLMFVLSEIGIDIAPLIASAGVLGLAIGFGAQKLVQDIITGVFIQLENAMNVGEVVTVGGSTGTIEKLTIRSVSLRDLQGVLHIIPFSSVDMVSNYMREFAFHVADMGIAYREDLDDAKAAMLAGFDELRAMPAWDGAIMGDLQWFGVQELGDSAVVLRARIKCAPGMQWGVGRAYNEILKKLFDARGIEIPFPHQTVYFGEDKTGRAPAAHVVVDRTPGGGAALAEAPAAPSLEKPVEAAEPPHAAPPRSDDT